MTMDQIDGSKSKLLELVQAQKLENAALCPLNETLIIVKKIQDLNRRLN